MVPCTGESPPTGQVAKERNFELGKPARSEIPRRFAPRNDTFAGRLNSYIFLKSRRMGYTTSPNSRARATASARLVTASFSKI
jgi:hypothetical protein